MAHSSSGAAPQSSAHRRGADGEPLLALDVGGANLKLADGRGFARTKPFPLWRQPEQLAAALGSLLAEAPPAGRLAVTMTGELADCFATKRDGVRHILDAVEEAAAGRPLRVYATDGRFVSAQQARESPLDVAAANWHALARFAARFAGDGPALLIDIGSTTSDLVPIVAGRPAPRGTTDPERLLTGELVYTGVVRSPLCAIVSSLPWRGGECPVAQELFATSLDAYLTLGDLPERTGDLQKGDPQTADGRPATRAAAHRRLARAICADEEIFDGADARAAADALQRAQLARLGVAGRQVVAGLPAPPARCVVSGQGAFLARRLAARLCPAAEVVSLDEQLGPEASDAAAAHALAVVAREAP